MISLLGFALAVMGLSMSDFERLEMREFTACCRAYNAQRRADVRDRWERMRLAAAITIQPHVKGRITPQRLLPFDWEKPRKKKRAPIEGREQSRARFEALAKGMRHG